MSCHTSVKGEKRHHFTGVTMVVLKCNTKGRLFFRLVFIYLFVPRVLVPQRPERQHRPLQSWNSMQLEPDSAQTEDQEILGFRLFVFLLFSFPERVS